ncbi:hypothetical protein TNCV_634431 [Trichonephila clavipes]|nr:hypothetical protein TNCV_634431 [Trichonephila clavipes]
MKTTSEHVLLSRYNHTMTLRDGPRNLNHGQVTRMTPELAPPLLTITPLQRDSSVNPTPLAQAANQGEGHPEGPSQDNNLEDAIGSGISFYTPDFDK